MTWQVHMSSCILIVLSQQENQANLSFHRWWNTPWTQTSWKINTWSRPGRMRTPTWNRLEVCSLLWVRVPPAPQLLFLLPYGSIKVISGGHCWQKIKRYDMIVTQQRIWHWWVHAQSYQRQFLSWWYGGVDERASLQSSNYTSWVQIPLPPLFKCSAHITQR